MIKLITQKVISVRRYCILAFFTAFCANVQAQDYMGANAVLQLVQERHAKPVSNTNDEAAQLRGNLKAFSRNAATMAPGDAARRWLEFVDRAVKINDRSSGVPFGGSDLLNALPPPPAWNDLARDIAARPPAKNQGEIREAGLRLLAAALTENVAARTFELTNLETKVSQLNDQSEIIQWFQQVSQAMAAASDDPGIILNSLAYQLSSGGMMGNNSLNVPNLVSLVGPDKAEAFLRKAIIAPNVVLQFNDQNQTSRLAQKLALELVDQMKTPQWGLVNSLDAVDLYEALDKRFGNQTNNSPPPGFNAPLSVPPPNFAQDNGKGLAQIYYMLGLISQGRTQEAVAVARKCQGQESYYYSDAFDAMDRAGYDVQLDDFLHELLSQDPKLPFWDEYVDFAARAGQTTRMVNLVRSTLARGDVGQSKKSELSQILFKALLADDDIADGVQKIGQLIASNDVSPNSQNVYTVGQLAALLARIGVLTTNSEWTEEGIKAAKQWLTTSASQDASGRWQNEPVILSLTQTLLELNRGPDAESILANALANATLPGNSQVNYGYGNGDSQGRSMLAALTRLYFKAGRYDDVLNLLQNSPDWGTKDLSELFDSNPWDDEFSVMSLHNGSSSLPIPYIAAASLAARGRTAEARRITYALLNKEPALDRGYELLLSLDGTNAIPRLDEMFKRDQFEPRPLIWKAYLLEQQGRLDDAETTVRKAITIDPSDGKEGRGDRMRAYAELADIRDARGDAKEADYYRQIVKAIRVSEDADQFYLAGLLKRAIAMYEEGLDHFADAYCIQSRLAIQLAALGKTAEAAEHYRRAYELMPDSFGRVESHCFGCERVFNGEQAQSIAEKVFTQLVAERPDKPQVYYLLGYLQMEENHYSAAWTNFQTAVRLDPDYLNAWAKLQDVSAQILVPPGEKAKIAFNLLRLDPLQRHSSPDFSSVTDLAHLWNAAAVASSLQPEPVSDLFPLTASATALEKKENENVPAPDVMMAMNPDDENQTLTPASAVAGTPYVSFAGQLIFNNYFASIDQ